MAKSIQAAKQHHWCVQVMHPRMSLTYSLEQGKAYEANYGDPQDPHAPKGLSMEPGTDTIAQSHSPYLVLQTAHRLENTRVSRHSVIINSHRRQDALKAIVAAMEWGELSLEEVTEHLKRWRPKSKKRSAQTRQAMEHGA